VSNTKHLQHERDWLMRGEVAALAGIERQTFNRWVKEGRGPKSNGRTRKAWRSKRRDVENWIAAGFKNDVPPS
jgi:predicted DNA-binding transcriptional regulator AlpA